MAIGGRPVAGNACMQAASGPDEEVGRESDCGGGRGTAGRSGGLRAIAGNQRLDCAKHVAEVDPGGYVSPWDRLGDLTS